MDAVISLITQSLIKVWATFQHNWPFLLVSVSIAVLLKLYLKPEKITAFLLRHQGAGVVAATAAAVGTPLCSCGSTAVILGMMATSMPWAPIVAFMVSSPLSSPESMVYSAGLFGWPFALVYFGMSVLLGLFGGALAAFAEKRGWLANQSRFAITQAESGDKLAKTRGQAHVACCSASTPVLAVVALPVEGDPVRYSPVHQRLAAPAPTAPTCGCSDTSPAESAAPNETCGCAAPARQTLQFHFDGITFLKELWLVGRQLLVMFFGFAFIGYLINGLIPTEWVERIFGSGTIYSVPLAAVLGLPLYVNSEASLPLVRAMLENGMSQGAAMAFLITGSGTSIGALTGALTIARWRVVALIVAVLIVGATLAGYLFNVMVALGWV